MLEHMFEQTLNGTKNAVKRGDSLKLGIELGALAGQWKIQNNYRAGEFLQTYSNSNLASSKH